MRNRDLILLEGSQTVETYLTKGRIPSFLNGLAAEARKAGSFDTFKHDYLIEIKHGIYWHWTNDPHFQIDPAKGPRDMTSMGGGHMDPGKLMVTSHLENWAAYGSARGRPYVALVDLSAVPRNEYYQVKRSFGNEFFVNDPSKAKVARVVSPQAARRLDRRWDEYMPASEDQLRRFYALATGQPQDQLAA